MISLIQLLKEVQGAPKAIILAGAPGAGKSSVIDDVISDLGLKVMNIDDFFIKNLNRASDIATFLNSLNKNVIISLVYPYKETRDYFNSLCSDVFWVYLTYEGERGREKYHVEDFEVPENENVLHLDTSKLTIEECTKKN